MDKYSPRKKVTPEEQRKNLQRAAVQEVLPGYEDYLILLQERNRLLKKMRKKSKKQIDNERKEQGFSIYVSGANAGKQKGKPSKQENEPDSPEPIDRQIHYPARLKTAGDVTNKRIIDHKDLEIMAAEEKRKVDEKKRLKTAPARERRRNWMAGSINIKTERGERCKLKAPEIVTGNYEDDFEESDGEKNNKDDSDSEIEIDASKFNKNSSVKSSNTKNVQQKSELRKSPPKPQSRKVPPKPPPDSESEEESENEKLMLSIADIKKLRESLAMNKSIRESMAREISSEEDVSERASPIPEEDIEEDLVPAMDSVSLDNRDRQKKVPPSFKPTDTVVLELAAPPTKAKVQKNLSAVRKKDTEDDMNEFKSKKKPVESSAKEKAPLTLQSNQKKPSNRPLSASRINRKTALDTEEEASAVLEALKAENEKASKHKQDSVRKLPQTPKQRQRPSSAGNIKPSPRQSVEVRPPSRSTKESQKLTKSVSNSSEVRGSHIKNVNSSSDVTGSGGVEESFLADNRISEVMKKVLLMQPKQQKKLMKALSKIDASAGEEEKEENSIRPPISKPVKATRPVNDMVNKESKRSVGKFSPTEDCIEVNMELVSNWGHPEMIGLTELQFFDKDRQMIAVRKNATTVHGGRDQQGAIDVLFNGKTKTNKERNMWCCRYRKGVPVELCLTLPFKKPDTEIAQIKIWNHNKSLTDLDIGVKHARIFIGGILVFDGNIEKGCGNQVFDYGFVITLQDMSDKVSPRDHTNSTSPISLSPVIHTRSPTSDKPPLHRKSQNVRSPSPSPSADSSRNPFEQAFKKSTQQKIRSPSPSSENRYPITVPSLNLKNDPLSPSSRDKPVIRSETRTMNNSERDLQRPVVLSDRSGSSFIMFRFI